MTVPPPPPPDDKAETRSPPAGVGATMGDTATLLPIKGDKSTRRLFPHVNDVRCWNGGPTATVLTKPPPAPRPAATDVVSGWAWAAVHVAAQMGAVDTGAPAAAGASQATTGWSTLPYAWL